MSELAPPDELSQALGATGERSVDAEAGTARIHYIVKPEFCHSGGIAQGGFVTGWLDSAMAFAAMSRADRSIWLATLELKVSFFGPARAQTEVVSDGWIAKPGRSIVFLESRLTELDGGKVLATSSSTAKLVALKR